MKEHRNCAVRAKEKNWEEKVKKKCCIKKMHYLDLVVLLLPSCSEGRAYPLQLPTISFALANLYSIDFFFQKRNNFTD